MKPAFALFLLASGAVACGKLPDVSNVVDLRVLAVRCDPAGFLVDPENPGAATDDQLRAQLTALVVDPAGGGQEVSVTGVGCPDYIDTITSASMQGSKLCPPASATSQIPAPIGPALTTVPVMAADTPLRVPPLVAGGYEYNPVVSFGLTQAQVSLFFTLDPQYPAEVNASIQNNRDFGLPGIVNLNFDLGGEHAEAIKRVVYWPLLDPNQQPNHNPTLDGIRLYRGRDATTGNPTMPIDQTVEPEPVVSISAGDKLYVEPDYTNAVEYYDILVKNVDTGMVEKRTGQKELLRFQFYATVGSFDPPMQFSELDPALVGGTLHTDSEYKPPDAQMLLAGGKVTIWIVTHDERAGTDWMKRVITVVP